MTLPALLALIQDAATSAAQTPSTTAGAEGGPAGWGSSLMQFFPLIAIFAIFYFVLIGPERKARKKREEMLKKLSKGDKVMTSSGIYGSVVNIQDNVVTLQIDEGVRVRFSRASIQEVQQDEPAAASKKP